MKTSPTPSAFATPTQYARVIKTLFDRVPNIGDAIVSTHCHNDLGMAVANSLAACEVGARQVECTINGIGERAGNAALEEIVMALKTRHDFYGLTTNIKTERLYPLSRMVSTITGLKVQRNKAIVGQNAFAHEAGIHQDGMLKERSTYEIMRPEEVGVPKTDLVLGKHSGRHALRDRVTELGYHLTDAQIEALFHDFKALADKKKEVYDEDLVVLVEKHILDVTPHWKLEGLHTTAGMSVTPTATVAIRRPDGVLIQDAAIGDGPLDAIFKAVERVTGIAADLREFAVACVTAGKDAQGEVSLRTGSRQRRPKLPRPGRLDRHHRGLGRGVHQRRQRHPHPPRARPAAGGHRQARSRGLTHLGSGGVRVGLECTRLGVPANFEGRPGRDIALSYGVALNRWSTLGSPGAGRLSPLATRLLGGPHDRVAHVRARCCPRPDGSGSIVPVRSIGPAAAAAVDAE